MISEPFPARGYELADWLENSLLMYVSLECSNYDRDNERNVLFWSYYVWQVKEAYYLDNEEYSPKTTMPMLLAIVLDLIVVMMEFHIYDWDYQLQGTRNIVVGVEYNCKLHSTGNPG